MASHVELDDLIRLGRIQHLAVQFDNIPTTIQVGESRFHTFFRLTRSKDTDTQRRKNIIKFPQVATTSMACPDMSGERELLQALDKVVRFDAVGEVKPVNKIAIYGTDNTKLMVIEKK